MTKKRPAKNVTNLPNEKPSTHGAVPPSMPTKKGNSGGSGNKGGSGKGKKK